MTFRLISRAAILLLLVLTAACSLEQDQGVTGLYLGTQKFGIAQAPSVIVLQLSQHGSALTGDVTPPFQTGEIAIFDGQISGTNFRWDVKSGSITYRYEGVQ